MRFCVRCGTPTSEDECFCGSRTVELHRHRDPDENPDWRGQRAACRDLGRRVRAALLTG